MEHNQVFSISLVDLTFASCEAVISFGRWGRPKYSRMYVATRERIRRLMSILGEGEMYGVRIFDDKPVSSLQYYWDLL